MMRIHRIYKMARPKYKMFSYLSIYLYLYMTTIELWLKLSVLQKLNEYSEYMFKITKYIRLLNASHGSFVRY